MKAKTTSHANRGLNRFLAAHGADVTGVISGYDRIRLRGSLRHLYQPSFMFRYLCEAGLRPFAPSALSAISVLRRFGKLKTPTGSAPSPGQKPEMGGPSSARPSHPGSLQKVDGCER